MATLAEALLEAAEELEARAAALSKTWAGYAAGLGEAVAHLRQLAKRESARADVSTRAESEPPPERGPND